MRRGMCLVVALSLSPLTHVPAQVGPTGPLVVYNAGSLAIPFQRLLAAFVERYPGVVPAQEHSGSVAAVRKISDLGKIPDVIAVADYRLIPELLFPDHASWYATFATNALALVYAETAVGHDEITPDNWFQILQRPDVRWGRADPLLDPAGYRALMAFQLAERHYAKPGLAARLLRASPRRFVRSKSADLVALIQLGELDYAWTYASIAAFHGLKAVALPAELTLADPQLEHWYRQALVRLPGSTGGGRDSIAVRGEPIAYALTIPTGAPHPETAAAFVAFIFSTEGASVLTAAELTPIGRPVVRGPGRPPAGLGAVPGMQTRQE